MIDFTQDYNVVKVIFDGLCVRRGIPTNNKAIALYTLAEKLDENPDDEEVRDLLFGLLADEELLITQAGVYNGYEVEETYQDVQRSYQKLWKSYREQADLEDTFSDYQTFEKSFSFGQAANPDDAFMEEADRVAQIAYTCLKLGEEISRDFLENVCRLIGGINGDPFLTRCKPLILFLAISRYQKKFEQASSCEISVKELFTYQEYPICEEKKKTVKRLKTLTKFYRKLDKLYKKEETVDRKQCRYGFFATSNLTDFILKEQFDKCKVFCPPFLYQLQFMDMSCIDSSQGEKWEDEALFGVSEEVQSEYYELEEEAGCYTDFEVDDKVWGYLRLNEELVLDFMKAFYRDADKLVAIVTEVYEICQLQPTEQYAKFEPAIKAEIYYALREYTDQMVEKMVMRVCMQ